MLRSRQWRGTKELFGYRVLKFLGCEEVEGCVRLPCSLVVLHADSQSGQEKQVMKVIPCREPVPAMVLKSCLAVQHKSIAPILDAGQDEAHRVVWTVSKWDVSLALNQDLSPEIVLQRLLQLCNALHLLHRKVPSILAAGFNLKPSNITAHHGTVRVHDWFVSHLSGQDSVASDQRGLARWLCLRMQGGIPSQTDLETDPLVSDEFKQLQSDLVTGSGGNTWFEALRDHPWLVYMSDKLQVCPSPMGASRASLGGVCSSPLSPAAQSLNWTVGRRMHMSLCQIPAEEAPAVSEAEREEVERMVCFLMLKSTLQGNCTDRCVASEAFAQFPRLAREYCERNNWTLSDDPDCIDFNGLPELGNAAHVDISPGFLEGTWYVSCEGLNCEDTVINLKNLNGYCGRSAACQDDYFCAIFDGHGGPEAAEWCTLQMPHAICTSEHYLTDPTRAMEVAFHEVHRSFISESNMRCGATATTVLIRDRTIYAANVGDSRAVVGGKGHVTTLTKDHRASDPEEAELVRGRGGCVLNIMGGARVEGTLAVTRSIGDAHIAEKLTRTPTTMVHAIRDDDEFMVVASDGLWDVMQGDEVCSFVSQCRDEVLRSMAVTEPTTTTGTDTSKRTWRGCTQAQRAGMLSLSRVDDSSTRITSKPSSSMFGMGKKKIRDHAEVFYSGVRPRVTTKFSKKKHKTGNYDSLLSDKDDSVDSSRTRLQRYGCPLPFPSLPYLSLLFFFLLSLCRRRLADMCSDNDATAQTALSATSGSEMEVYSDFQVVAEALVQEARDRGSEDDCGVAIVFLDAKLRCDLSDVDSD